MSDFYLTSEKENDRAKNEKSYENRRTLYAAVRITYGGFENRRDETEHYSFLVFEFQ